MPQEAAAHDAPTAEGQPGTISYCVFLQSCSAVTHGKPITAVIAQLKASVLQASAPALACLMCFSLPAPLKAPLG